MWVEIFKHRTELQVMKNKSHEITKTVLITYFSLAQNSLSNSTHTQGAISMPLFTFFSFTTSTSPGGQQPFSVNPFHISDRLSPFKKFNSVACTWYTNSPKLFNVVSVISVNIWMLSAKNFPSLLDFHSTHKIFLRTNYFNLSFFVYIQEQMRLHWIMYNGIQILAMRQPKVHILFRLRKLQQLPQNFYPGPFIQHVPVTTY